MERVMDLQFFGGRGASGLPTAHPSGGGAGKGDDGWTETPNIKAPGSLKEALGGKGAPMSITKAARDANPYYDGSYREFSENCQRAVVAYEARRRGYDVTAQPTFKNDEMPSNGKWRGAFQHGKTQNVGATTASKAEANVEKVMSSYGNGSRAVLSFGWKRGNQGHVINVERHGGKTLYIDAQVGAKYNPKELFNKINTNSVKIMRTDNLRMSDRAKKSVEVAGSRR